MAAGASRSVTRFGLHADAVIGAAVALFIACPAMAAPRYTPPAIVPVPYSWTGLYVGANGGRGSSSFNTTFMPGQFPNTIDFTTQGPHTSVNGGVYGGQLGYNWQLNNWVLGVEGDFDGASSLSGTQQVSVPTMRFPGRGTNEFSVTDKIEWLASIRGRIGVLLGPGLLYFTGGVAWEEAKSSLSAHTHSGVVVAPELGDIFTSATFTSTRSGFVLGGGYEWLFAPHWTVRGEYLFYDFGKSDNNVLTFPIAQCGSGPTPANLCNIPVTTGKNFVNVVRFGLNYRF